MGFIRPGKAIKKRKAAPLPDSLKKKVRKETKGAGHRSLSIIERLPKELLHRVFVFAGLDQNNLPLVNKRINYDLRLYHRDRNDDSEYVPNHGLAKKVIEQNFLRDMNSMIDFKKYRNTIKRFRRLENHDAQRNDLADALEEFLKEFEAKKLGLDVAVLHYKFFNYSVAKRLRIGDFAAYTKDSNHTSRVELLDSINDALESMISSTNSDTASAISKADKALELQKTPFIPQEFFERKLNSAALELLLLLHTTQGYSLNNLDPFISSIAKSIDVEPKPQLVERVLAMGKSAAITGFSVAELLRAHQDQKSEDTTAIVQLILKHYYSQPSTQLESFIWQEVIQSKNIDLYNTVVEHSGTPSAQVITSM
ncbi:hypothetical protein PGUG_04803 [Meyerozyma guilliermondii ATCC 6260]|uniref:F-box domain-containing protein n=1 Tax=Meyerozyma guilliermondii (strain ATCC 6260 / CBS 566 / DSM 6381 / JCM 1539 / NBRC 10279 / NRRL Y-324) TaxID=294746 RepID=A5DNF2_PICGU|nr:uncharacterized protein PGUG_04803 [Meyerozyma guilliermondii ATCC 6260]EDK40705.2 hypothetical protein PGUG_04803 [Meyerozyma guilliermondii ATCC 6260]